MLYIANDLVLFVPVSPAASDVADTLFALPLEELKALAAFCAPYDCPELLPIA